MAKTVTTYLYDADDRLSSETKTSGTISATTSYLWDANGNLTQKVEPTQTTLYTWDSNNRLVEVKRGGIAATASSVATYQYDANGNRVGKTTADGKIVAYLVDSNLPYAQVAQEKFTLGAVSDTTTYLYGIERIQMTRAGQGTYYHDDGLDSTRVLTDQTGNLTDNYDYDDYGALQSQTGTTKNDFLFAGEQFDVEAGLYYNRARHLDVNTGRFTGLDPFEGNPSQPITLNKYAYAGGDPVNATDPSGLVLLGQQMEALSVDSSLRREDDIAKLNNAKNALKNVCKGVDNVFGKVRHHFIPFFLRGKGGKKTWDEWELIGLNSTVHNEFHGLLDILLKMRGFAGRQGANGKGGIAYYMGVADTGGLLEVFNVLVEGSQIFDDVCGEVSPGFKMADEVNRFKSQMNGL
ncbi:MAG: RHS repeat-associated core domain-containing protein [Gallionella sp.]